MITKPAAHRVQNIGAQMAVLYAKEELKSAVSTYLEWRQLQEDAVEDDDLHLASSIGKSMRSIRERYDQQAWLKEWHRQDTANDF
ncbi:hypothetical protein EXT62_10140 [Pectobacterium carotovorum subsp. carotovorum]|nr:hypothetical protein [Pectobacterium carotovorum]MCL6397245.1 hypothetical protein [Pectobacterium carotovorum subsp. carotovorum]